MLNLPLQAKLRINQPGDRFEREEDRMADVVMCMPEPSLQRRVNGSVVGDSATPPIVHDVLRSSGQPLNPAIRGFMESRFGHDFGQVRVHNDGRAAESARAVNALAYTVGQNVIFAQDNYRPQETSGRQLLAHELTHVIQQRHLPDPGFTTPLSVDSNSSASEREARANSTLATADGYSTVTTSPSQTYSRASRPMISRADPASVTLVRNLGQTAATGLQFFPTNVTDTQVGPVSVRGGLLSGRASRLNVIIGENMTIRTLARILLPFWTTATPFTPPGATAPLPLDIITEDELARGLLVYNRTFLPVPAMTKWRSGLRFPLPVEIDEATGVATLHPLHIRALNGAFDAAWLPLLDTRASALAAPSAATLTADATAFLANETTSLARGIHLGARALTNAPAELPFIREVFRQLGAGAFDVALAFMDFLVNRQIDLLAAQRDGAAILAEIRTAVAAAPASVSAEVQAKIDRTNLMLGRVAGVAASAPPAAARARAEKTVNIDTIQLNGANHTPANDVRVANSILAQCNIRLSHTVDATATPAETTTWLGGNTDLRASPNCGSATGEERSLYRNASTTYGMGSRLRAFFVASYSNYGGSLAYSVPPYCATGAASTVRNMIIIQNASNRGDLAHEIIHVLQNTGTHRPAPNLMSASPTAVALSNAQCTRAYNNS